MGFITQNGASQTIGYVQSGYWVGSNEPFDKRDVVQYRADLTDDSLWVLTANDNDIRHSGMIVAVIKDDVKYNGLYYLQDENYCDCFVEAFNNELQHNKGWLKLPLNANGSVTIDNYTIKNNNDEALNSDVQQDGLHVVRVDGGWF